MQFYVGRNAIEDLNKYYKTPIFTEDGEDTGGYLKIFMTGEPSICNLFGAGEALCLTRLEFDETGAAECELSDGKQVITLGPLRINCQTKWVYEVE